MQINVSVYLAPGEKFEREPDRAAARVHRTLDLLDETDTVSVFVYGPVISGTSDGGVASTTPLEEGPS